MNHKIFLYVGFLFSIVGWGQTASEVIAGINKQFTSSKPLQYNTQYNLYKDDKSKVVHQSYKGIFQKSSSNEMYMKIDKTEFLNTNKYTIKISSTEKAMIVSNRQVYATGDFDINKLLAYCTIGSFKDYKAYWEIVLINREYSSLEYSKIVLQVYKNYWIKKQIFYYNTQVNFSGDYRKQDYSSPRLEIEYSNHNNKEVSTSIFNSNLYFTISKTNSIMPSVKYKSYEVDDNRENTINKKLK
jgi:hypothetical protein